MCIIINWQPIWTGYCWIGLLDYSIRIEIHFEKWIWIVNHIFVMDLDWIDNPKTIGFSNSLYARHWVKNRIK